MTQQFGRYRLDRQIGRGAVGEVWLAHDMAADRSVALKILTIGAAEDPEYRRRFEREAHIGANLRNPHIVPIHDFGEQCGRLFLDMAHVPGTDLAGRLRGEPMRAPQAVDIVSQVAEALDAAHRVGLIHRDVKPGNIIVHPSGFAYLIDFGIARASNQTTLTATGFTVGTLAYMAPERFAGDCEARSDVYALACVLFECLTARRPFGGTDAAQQLHAHLHADPPRPSTSDPAIPRALDEVIARGMAKSIDDRYPSAGELAAAARAAVGMPHPVRRDPPLPEQRPAGTHSPARPRHTATGQGAPPQHTGTSPHTGTPPRTRTLPGSGAASANTPAPQPRPTRALPTPVPGPSAPSPTPATPLAPVRARPPAPVAAARPEPRRRSRRRTVILIVVAAATILAAGPVAACAVVVTHGGPPRPIIVDAPDSDTPPTEPLGTYWPPSQGPGTP